VDLWVSLGACSIGPFFHPVYYFGFLGGLVLLLVFRGLEKKFDPWLLLYYLTFLPYFLTIYLYFQPNLPEDPIYKFFFEKQALIKLFWFYVEFDGVAIPLAILAVIFSPEARKWFLPFALLFSFLCLFGAGLINHAAHFALQNSLYLTLLSAIGLGYLIKTNRCIRTVIYAVVLIIILPPYIQEVSSRIKNGWEGIVDQEQRTVGEFVRSSTDPNSSFVILPESSYSLVAVEGLGERKVTLGYFFHLDRYESKASIEKWDREIKDFFLATDRQKQMDFLKRFKANYIFIGPDEKGFLLDHHQDIELFKKNFICVFKNENIDIFFISY
jgi:hypothetical protein